MKNLSIVAAVVITAFAAVLLINCGGNAEQHGDLEGSIDIDGSSTVYPITEAVAEEFRKVQSRVNVKVGISGTGGGFKRFCVGETDINDASRLVKAKEAKKAKANGVEFIELPVAFDGLSVMVNPKNTFVDYLTVQELKKIWQPGSTVKTWADVRPGFPANPIKLFGPGTDSGTFDYFTKAINGKEQACRPDVTFSEDDNNLVQGIAGDANSLGFFGYAYYENNKDKLKLVPIESGNGPIAPSPQTINDGTYAPLSRPIFIYVSKAAAERPEVDAFVRFYIESAPKLTTDSGYVPLPQKIYDLAMKRYENRVVGSVFSGKKNMSIFDIMNSGQ